MPPGLTEVLGVVPLEVFANAFNSRVLLESAPVVRALSPDLAVIARLDRSGVIVTAPPSSHIPYRSRRPATCFEASSTFFRESGSSACDPSPIRSPALLT